MKTIMPRYIHLCAVTGALALLIACGSWEQGSVQGIQDVKQVREAKRLEIDARTSYREMLKEHAPVIFTGRVLERTGNTVSIYGQALPTTNYRPEGSPRVGDQTNLLIAGYDAKLAQGLQTPSGHHGFYTFTGTTSGTNALGGPTRVYMYEPIPKKMIETRERMERLGHDYLDTRIAYAASLTRGAVEPRDVQDTKQHLQRTLDSLSNLKKFGDLEVGGSAVQLAGKGLPETYIQGVRTFVFHDEGVLLQTDNRNVLSLTYIFDPEAIAGYWTEFRDHTGDIQKSRADFDTGTPLFNKYSPQILEDLRVNATSVASDAFWEIEELTLWVFPAIDESGTIYIPNAQVAFTKQIGRHYQRYLDRLTETNHGDSWKLRIEQWVPIAGDTRVGDGNKAWIGKVVSKNQGADGLFRLSVALPKPPDSPLRTLTLTTPLNCTAYGINPLNEEEILAIQEGDLIRFTCSRMGADPGCFDVAEREWSKNPTESLLADARFAVSIRGVSRIVDGDPKKIVFGEREEEPPTCYILTMRIGGGRSRVLAATVFAPNAQNQPIDIDDWDYDPILDKLAEVDVRLKNR